MSKKAGQIALPALRGIMGDWVYYSSLMDLAEISSRVRFAEEVHKNKALSDMIQRRLKTSRGKEISRYLETQPERFLIHSWWRPTGENRVGTDYRIYEVKQKIPCSKTSPKQTSRQSGF